MSCAGYRVRTGDAADIVEVLRLERAIPDAPHWTEAEYAAIVDSQGCAEVRVRRCLFVAEAEDGLLGFAVGKLLVSEGMSLAELESVAVSVSARRGGVGTALCEAVIRWCKERGAAEVELEVRAGKCGWRLRSMRGWGFSPLGGGPDTIKTRRRTRC